MDAPFVYLDHAASSPPLREVRERLPELLAASDGNPSSAHAPGVRARRAMEETRERIASRLRLGRRDIVFTSGATEANNLVLRSFEERPGAVVVSPFEHPSIARAAERIPASRRVALPMRGLAPDLDALRDLLRSREVALVCLMHVQNETGLILPVERVGALIAEASPRTRFLVDAVQSFLRDPIDPHAARIDYLTFSGHKVGALKGVGGLAIREGARGDLAPLLLGGGQEEGLRAGTENPLAIASLGVAAAAWEERGAAWDARFRALSALLRERLAGLAGVSPLPAEGAVPRIVGVTLRGLPAADPVVRMLSDAGYGVSSGAACSTGRPGRRPVPSGPAPSGEASSYLRVSFGPDTEEERLPGFVDALAAALGRAKGST